MITAHDDVDGDTTRCRTVDECHDLWALCLLTPVPHGAYILLPGNVSIDHELLVFPPLTSWLHTSFEFKIHPCLSVEEIGFLDANSFRQEQRQLLSLWHVAAKPSRSRMRKVKFS